MSANIPALEQALHTAFEHVDYDRLRLATFPHRTACGRWEATPAEDWVQGFWCGLLWLRYALSGEKVHGDAAASWTARLFHRAGDQTHDLGFLFELSAVLGYRLTGEARYHEVALQAAAALRARLRPGGWIQAWGPPDDPRRHNLVIIDTMMNLSFLLWAAQESGDESFAAAALTHARNTRRSHIRPDGRTYHVMVIDPQAGEIEGPHGGQGLTPQSCWSRGQAWAIYGYTNVARLSGEVEFLDTARLLADAWLRLMAGHDAPPWDFEAPLFLSPVPRDTSAGAIAACGLLDLADLLGEAGTAYSEHAHTLLERLAAQYLNSLEQQGILREGTSNLPQGFSKQSLIYGDYYFVEALLRLLHPDVAGRVLGHSPAG